jgi:RNA polymerase sigma factor for flagellar operon FliA
MNPLMNCTLGENAALQDLAINFMPLVKRIAFHLAGRLSSHISVEDLVQAGMIGLIKAKRNFNAGKGACFHTYASLRIRGAMLDEIRHSNWMPRSLASKARQMAEIIRRIESDKGREARDAEIANAMAVSLDDYFATLQRLKAHCVIDVDALGDEESANLAAGCQDGPLKALEDERLASSIAAAIRTLPDREAQVLSLYYNEEMNLREIGEILKVSESRVCQIHGQALLRLRVRLGTQFQAATRHE